MVQRATASRWPSFPDSSVASGQPGTLTISLFPSQPPLSDISDKPCWARSSPLSSSVNSPGSNPGRWGTHLLSFLLCSISKQCCLYLNKIALHYFLLVLPISAATDHSLTSVPVVMLSLFFSGLSLLLDMSFCGSSQFLGHPIHIIRLSLNMLGPTTHLFICT